MPIELSPLREDRIQKTRQSSQVGHVHPKYAELETIHLRPPTAQLTVSRTPESQKLTPRSLSFAPNLSARSHVTLDQGLSAETIHLSPEILETKQPVIRTYQRKTGKTTQSSSSDPDYPEYPEVTTHVQPPTVSRTPESQICLPKAM